MTRSDTETQTLAPDGTSKPDAQDVAERSEISFAPDQVKEGEKKSQTYLMFVARRFAKSWTGIVGLILVALILFSALFADFLSPVNPRQPYVNYEPPQRLRMIDRDGGFHLIPFIIPLRETGDLDPITFQPVVELDYDNAVKLVLFGRSWEYRLLGLIPTNVHFFTSPDGAPIHLLGTDKLGRDIFSRALHGARLTLFIALIVVTVTSLIGTSMGILSGYFGGRLDTWLQRFVEVFLAFPELALYLAPASLIPVTAPSRVFIFFVIAVLAALRWARMSREIRAKTLSISRLDYVKAGVAVGATDVQIMVRHVLPNVMSHVIVSVTILVPEIVLLESFLGFLGFAVKEPLISLGLMLREVQNFSSIGAYPWLLSPVAFVLLIVFAFNAFGDGLRDAIDPY